LYSKFPLYICTRINLITTIHLKEKIIIKATEMFFKLGFKSVTMDDISAKLGISKKTLYKYFSNKEELIEAGCDYIHVIIHKKFEDIIQLGKNAIEENFIVREMFDEMFKTDGDAPLYQLKKHYPFIYDKIRERESHQCKSFFHQNLEKGIKQGLYCKEINIEQTVLFYYLLIFGINEHYESEKEVNKNELGALKYHTKSIATAEGLKELEYQLSKLN
jgi:hypothetical protein